ncbi:hypothetical protein DFS33DRAFT_1276446 [Desarmillaria ectypa]|nr:hypothetical protein DFS33DRAFT_1276446 [Desarmillaria ectypa]
MSLLLGIPDGVAEWGRKVVEVQETADVAQVVFKDSAVETCDLIIGADGVKSICRQALLGKEAYRAQYNYRPDRYWRVCSLRVTHALQSGIKADQVAMTFSRNGFFGHTLSLPTSTPVEEQQVMFWPTYATDTPPPRDLPSEDLRAIFMQKHGSWQSPYTGAFCQIIDAASRPTATESHFTKWLVLPRYENTPEDTQMLYLLLRHYLSDPEPLPKIVKAYEDTKIPRMGRILRLGRRQTDGKREISWPNFVAAGHLPLRVMLWLNPTHIYDVEKVAKYLAAMT